MKIINLLALILCFLIICGTVVSAQGTPFPIYGKITDDSIALKGMQVEVRNINTGASQLTSTDINGFFQAELPNFDSRFRQGDTIKVSLTFCESLSVCIKKGIVSGGGLELSFDVSKLDGIPTLPPEVEIINYVCPDGSKVSSADKCMKIIECGDGTLVKEPESCKDELEFTALDWSLSVLAGLLVIAVGLLGKFKWGKGFVGLANYYIKKGNEAKARKDYATAEKNYTRAAKMIATGVKKAKSGFYK